MARFFARVSPDVFDETEVRTRTAELAEWVGAAVAQYKLDAAKVFALGFSNGASIAASTMLLHPGVLAGGVVAASADDCGTVAAAGFERRAGAGAFRAEG